MKIPEISKRNKYWNRRFSGGFIYGKKSSDIAKMILPFLLRSKNIFVFGGGYGRTSFFLAKKIKGSCVSNIDVSANAIRLGGEFYKNLEHSSPRRSLPPVGGETAAERANSFQRVKNAGNLKFVQKDILKIKYKDAADAIVSLYLLSLFTTEEVDIALKNMRESLRDRGVLICNFLATDDDEYKMRTKTKSNMILCDKGQQFVKFYKRDQIKPILERNGFKVKKIFKTEEVRSIDVLHKKAVSRSWVAVADKI